MARIPSLLLAPLAALVLAGPARADDAPPCHGPEAAAAPAQPPDASARVEVPDVELVDQDGKAVRVRSLLQSGKPVVVSFVFTTCTTVCPMISTIVSRVQDRLGERAGRDVRLVSITVDPGRDTPSRLKAYAGRHHAGPGWTWLTGGRGTVEQVLRGMGAYTPNFADHPPMVLVGNGAGAWTRLNGFPSQGDIVARVEAYAAAPASREDRARAYFTDSVLRDQDGRAVRFYSDVLEGNVVVVNFIFTRCTDACPLLTRRMNAVRRALGDRFGRDVRFVSISVDPEFDTPQELRRFADRQGATFPGWTWLTGKKEDVDRVRGRLGEAAENPGDHSTGFLAANVRRGHWIKIRPDASPAIVAEQVRELADEDGNRATTGSTGPTAAR